MLTGKSWRIYARSPKRVEIQNAENQNIKEHSTTTPMLTQDEKNNQELPKNTIEKTGTFPSPENQDWKKNQVKNRKGKSIIKKYPKGQHYVIKPSNSPRSKSIQWQNRYLPQETKQNYKSWMGNEAKRTNKETTRTRKITKEGKMRKNKIELKDQQDNNRQNWQNNWK